ncbi:hypothetical protein [Mesorhizobium sp. CAU 1741]|uniref:hypothetical protein n=1 Tax=Mesorhizobium sp. CAU 1741 TaxID=3140366 RepID=UPI00325A6BFD
MKRKVIEAFDYAADGIHVNRLKAGRSYPFPAADAARFEAEGKLEPLSLVTEDGEPVARDEDEAVIGAPLDLSEAERAALPALDPLPKSGPVKIARGRAKRAAPKRT